MAVAGTRNRFEIKSRKDVSSALVRGGMGRGRNLIVDDALTDFTSVTHIKWEINHKRIRKMTPHKWARLQQFSYDLNLPLSDTHLYKLLGNSVTVPVIEAITKGIKKVLDADYEKSEPKDQS